MLSWTYKAFKGADVYETPHEYITLNYILSSHSKILPHLFKKIKKYTFHLETENV